MRTWLITFALLILAAPAFAQAPVPVQPVPSELRASTVCVESRPASGSAGSVTVPAVSGQSFYVNAVEVNATVAGAAPATLSNPAHVSATGLNGATFGMVPIAAQAIGTKIADYFYALSGSAMKGANSTAVVLSAPAVTNINWHISVCGYYAP